MAITSVKRICLPTMHVLCHSFVLNRAHCNQITLVQMDDRAHFNQLSTFVHFLLCMCSAIHLSINFSTVEKQK